MDILDDLKRKLGKEWLIDGERSIQDKFGELATMLLGNVAIRKGGKIYAIEEIEFYLYHDSHRDIITYPRNCEAGRWFFHASGVDIAFESHVEMKINEKNVCKPHLTRTAFFGGILIRAISETASGIHIKGPMKVVDELFDQFDAFGNLTDFPTLVAIDLGSCQCKPAIARHNLLPRGKTIEEKVNGILRYDYSASEIPTEDIYGSFAEFLKAPYRYTT